MSRSVRHPAEENLMTMAARVNVCVCQARDGRLAQVLAFCAMRLGQWSLAGAQYHVVRLQGEGVSTPLFTKLIAELATAGVARHWFAGEEADRSGRRRACVGPKHEVLPSLHNQRVEERFTIAREDAEERTPRSSLLLVVRYDHNRLRPIGALQFVTEEDWSIEEQPNVVGLVPARARN